MSLEFKSLLLAFLYGKFLVNDSATEAVMACTLLFRYFAVTRPGPDAAGPGSLENLESLQLPCMLRVNL